MKINVNQKLTDYKYHKIKLKVQLVTQLIIKVSLHN